MAGKIIDKTTLLSQMFDKGSWLLLNKKIAKFLGLEAAIYLGDLISKRQYFMDRNELNEEGEFFNTVPNIEESTTLSRKYQKKASDKLAAAGFINIRRAGTHGIHHFKINDGAIIEFLETGHVPTGSKTPGGCDPSPCGSPNKYLYNKNLREREGRKAKINKTSKTKQSFEEMPSPRRTLDTYAASQQELYRQFVAAWEEHFHAKYQKRDWTGPGGDWLEDIKDPEDARRYIPTFFKLPEEHFKGVTNRSFAIFSYKYKHNEMQDFYPQTKEYHVERQSAKGF